MTISDIEYPCAACGRYVPIRLLEHDPGVCRDCLDEEEAYHRASLYHDLAVLEGRTPAGDLPKEPKTYEHIKNCRN